MSSLKKSKSTQLGLALLLAGLVAAYVLFRGKKHTSSSLDKMIQKRLMDAGIGPNQALTWAGVARLESNDYQSNLFKSANNLFGMTQPKKRDTTSIGKTQIQYDSPPMYFARFSSPESSVDDLIMYLDAMGYPNEFSASTDQIAYMKDKGYFGIPTNQYENGVYSKVTKILNHE